jgi:hypothetical protein
MTVGELRRRGQAAFVGPTEAATWNVSALI